MDSGGCNTRTTNAAGSAPERSRHAAGVLRGGGEAVSGALLGSYRCQLLVRTLWVASNSHRMVLRTQVAARALPRVHSPDGTHPPPPAQARRAILPAPRQRAERIIVGILLSRRRRYQASMWPEARVVRGR